MRLGAATQQPNERLSYTIWYDDALTVGDTTTGTTVYAEPAGELLIDSIETFDDRIRFWVSGGVSGAQYKITASTLTTEGRVFEDEIILRVKEI
jgi:hypothetical protein